MKKEARGRKQKAKYEEESENSEFGFEYEFFVSGRGINENKSDIIKEKFELLDKDQSGFFFLPEYFESDE